MIVVSRSYKKHPVYTSKLSTIKYIKRQANKKARRAKHLDDGNYYRKLYEQWMIRDWRDYMTPRSASVEYQYVTNPNTPVRYPPRWYCIHNYSEKQYMDKIYKSLYKRK